MKSCRRCLSLLFACVLSLGLFSVAASAETLDSSNIKAQILAYSNDFPSAFGDTVFFTNPDNGTNEGIVSFSQEHTITKQDYEFRYRMIFSDITGKTMFKANKEIYFQVSNLALGHTAGSWSYSSVSWPYDILYYNFIYSDGTQSNLYTEGVDVVYNYSWTNYSVNLDCHFTPTKDVSKVVIYLKRPHTFSESNLNQTYTFYMFAGATGGPFSVQMEQPSDEAGFLSGILGWVKDISSSVTDGFSDMLSSIAQLPVKLWNHISTGLQGLFVPDEKYMSDYSDKWDELLSDRLGAVYQVCDIVVSSWDQISDADATNSIDMPAVTIPLGKDSFTFGGYDVQIVPEGFSVLVNAIKLVIGILASIAFINGLLKRYDEIMGVEQ